MAKSRLEPKKIVRYAESNVPRQGISGRPTPRIQSSTPSLTATSAPTSELSNPVASSPTPAPVAPPAPAPTPAPPAPAGETRGFLFDGATELTGSFLSPNSLFKYAALTAHMTITPTWGETETGSFALFAIGTPDDTELRTQLYLERTSGSFGYRDRLVSQRMSGSNVITKKTRLSNSPNYYSGGLSNVFLSVYMDKYGTKYTRENGQAAPLNGIEYLTAGSEAEVLLSTEQYINAVDHKLSIGGFNSGSDGYFQGRIDNFAAGYGSNFMGFNQSAKNYNNDSRIPVYYQFEGTVEADKGLDLEVVGTETYESSSL